MTTVIAVAAVQAQTQTVSPTSSHIFPANKSFAPEYPVIRSRNMSIQYQLDTNTRLHLSRVELWYSRGEQGQWQLYDYDGDRISPMDFIAPGEGVYRFLVIAVDQWGRRSIRTGDRTQSYQSTNPIPPAHVPAQQTVFVDYTSPKLYLYSPRGEIKDYRSDRLMVRWQGFDSYLQTKPMRLYCSSGNNNEWVPISPPLATAGQFEWKIPDHLQGGVRIRAVMTDMAGNTDVQTSEVVYIADKVKSHDPPDRYLAEAERDFKSKLAAPIITNMALDLPSQARKIQAQRAFRRGKLNSQRMEWTQAIEAYQESLDIDPTLIEAKVNLANAYFRTGKFESALKSFEMVLQEDPSRNNALFGLAQTQRSLNQHAKALETLELLLKQDREDYQAWKMHAEAAEKTGQFDLAKTSWKQAWHSPFQTIRQEAQQKLDQMN